VQPHNMLTVFDMAMGAESSGALCLEQVKMENIMLFVAPFCGPHVTWGPCPHSMARPRVADGGTASRYGGSCEYIE
jgi:hypothetical protein